jgi:hypothetical protein
MKTDREKELDNLFREGLENPARNANFREDDWAAMEDLLDKDRKRAGIIFWLPIISSAAALLLLVLGVLLIKHNQQPTLVKNNTLKQQPIYQGQSQQKNGSTSVQQPAAVQPELNAGVSSSRINNKQTNKTATIGSSAGKYVNNSVGKTQYRSRSTFNGSTNGGSVNTNGLVNENTSRNGELLAADMPSIRLSALNTAMPGAGVLPATNKSVIAPASKSAKNKISIKRTNFNRPQFALTVLASPDLNGVSSFQNSKVGSNVGLLFAVGVTKKFTISTGALYSIKPYMTDFDNYHSNYKFKIDPDNVAANCRILDIPINVDYQLYNKSVNKFSIGSGLSSYIMLRENYHYNYEYPNTPGPTDYNVINKNQYFLGVLNLDATYQRKLNSKISLAVEPYLKIPLTSIGASQVKLQSTGVAVGLTWNIHR